MHVMAYVQRSEESLQESVPTFHSEIRGQTHIVRSVQKVLSVAGPSHCPKVCFWDLVM